MKPNLALTLLGAALLAVPASFGQATSGVVGFSNVSAPSGTSLVVPTLVNSSVYQGNALISSDGLTITPSTSPGWTVGAYSKTSFTGLTPNYPKFYAEVVSGAYEGVIFDISTNSATNLTLAAEASPSVLKGTTVQIAIREHVTLNKLSTGAVGLSAFDDTASFYNADGSTTVRIYVGGANGWTTDNGSTPAGHTVIYPGTAVALTTLNGATLSLMGEVKPTKTKVPLYAANVNLVGPLNPASGTMLFGNNLTTTLAAFDDGMVLFSNDGNMSESAYFSDGSVIRNSSNVPLTGSSTEAIQLNRGIAITVLNDTVWTVNSPLAP